MSRPSYVMTTPLAHHDHFDASKFDANGRSLDRSKLGKRSRLKKEDIEQALFLKQLRDTAQKDLADFLSSRGFVGKEAQRRVLQRLRNGWRPKK